MKISEHVDLKNFTTMQLYGLARFVIEIETYDDIPAAIGFATERNLPWFVLGGGSNVIVGGDFSGVVILNRIKGFTKIDADSDSETYRIGAGELLDETIAKLCALDLSGIECLSLIPGTVGATPVQNVGAYGQEIAQTLIELTAYDIDRQRLVVLNNHQCGFSYRHSIFKSEKDRHYIICDITLKLSRTHMAPPFYPDIETYLSETQTIDYSPQLIREAVIAIRNAKLPPVEKVPSAGSFFKNPIIGKEFAEKFLKKFPAAPHWSMVNGQEKLAAGWLIDRAGLRGFKKYGFQLYPKNALVVTNIAEQNSAENLAKFTAEIISVVQETFGVTLEQEPETL
jgi:UDP-N-acetylmuramate dehydrogenase